MMSFGMGTAGVPQSDLRHDDDAALAERMRSRDLIGRRCRLGQEEEDRLLVITAGGVQIGGRRRSDRLPL